VKFEWDDEKALANIEKHGVSFGEATEVFTIRMLWRTTMPSTPAAKADLSSSVIRPSGCYS
jgi:uncharacterized DUF497 family protein